ncbi:Detected protein of confused Function [Hibiscus syriacus]|uniref:Detected protein of confused Function n=1 Tax=Hibiscus syriacus TaxID=106335 RepID=A0A6A2WPX1_HIBSY|nr:Detected protein of confused Function [Hibiscus syriacus]
MESLKLEHQFLRVAFEHLKKTIRANHRTAEKEISAVVSSVADSNEFSKDDAAQRCRARLDHLESVDAENLSEWNNVRLKQISMWLLPLPGVQLTNHGTLHHGKLLKNKRLMIVKQLRGIQWRSTSNRRWRRSTVSRPHRLPPPVLMTNPSGRKWVVDELSVISELKDVAGDLITEAVLEQEDAWVIMLDDALDSPGKLRCAHFAIYDWAWGQLAAEYAQEHLHANIVSAGLPRELLDVKAAKKAIQRDVQGI